MKVLLVDTNRAAVPIYQALLQGGHEVWVVGRNPSEPLAKICPRFVQMDYADTKRLLSLGKKHKFSSLVPGCTDVSYRACAEVNRGRFKGIDLPEVVDLFQRKDFFRGLASSLGIPVAASWTLGNPVPNAGIIIKPVDSFSGRAFNLGGGMDNSSSLLELFEILEELLGLRLRYDKLPWRHEDQKFFVADLDAVFAGLSWSPKVGKKEGVRQVLSWASRATGKG